MPAPVINPETNALAAPQMPNTPALTPGRRSGAPIPQAEDYSDITFDQLDRAMRIALDRGMIKEARQIAKAIDAGQYDQQNVGTSFGMGLSQGATLGFGDELAAGIRAATEQAIDPLMFGSIQTLGNIFNRDEQPEYWRDKSFSELVRERHANFFADTDYMERYRNALKSGRDMLETARRDNPYATFAGEFTGGAGVTAPLAAGQIAAGANKLTQLGRLGMLGGAEGAAAGYGMSEGSPIQAMIEGGNEERIADEFAQAGQDAATTGAIGATMAGTLPGAGVLARKVGQMVTAPFTKQARLTEPARQEIVAAIQKDLAARNITLEQAQREIRETPGMTAADIGDFTRTLTETMAQRPTEGATELAAFLRGRNIEQWQRMHPRLAEALTGDRNSNFYAARKQVLEDIATKSKNAYDTAYAVPARIGNFVTDDGRSVDMLNILRNPQMRPAMEYANSIREATGKGKLDLDNLNTGQQFSTMELDEIVKGMDTLVSKLYQDGQGNLAKIMKAKRNDFRDAVYVQNPAYRQARQTYANETLNNEALDKGLRIFLDDADLVEDVVRDMTPTERTHFKIGALQAITRKLGNKADTADLSKDLWNKNNSRAALRVAFGDKDKFEEFMDYIEREQGMYQTFYEAVGNSKTAKRMAQQEVAKGGGLAYALGYLGSQQFMPNMPMGLAGAVSRRGYETVAEMSPRQIAAMQEQSRQAANMMMSRDLNDIMRPQTIGGLLGTDIPLTGAAATTGLIGTGLANPNVESGM